MIRIDYKLYHDKLFSMYYSSELEYNIQYLKENGISVFGPIRPNRVAPYLDAGFYIDMKKWVQKEFDIVALPKDDVITITELEFKNKEDLVAFKMRVD